MSETGRVGLHRLIGEYRLSGSSYTIVPACIIRYLHAITSVKQVLGYWIEVMDEHYD